MIIKLLLITLLEAYVIWSMKSPNSIRLNGIQCTPNEQWFRNTNCCLKLLNNRSVQIYASAYLYRTLRAPLINAKVEKWMNGFRPYLFNIWGDACQIMANTRSQNKIVKMFLAMFLENSNLNHTCPFQGHMELNAVDFSLSMIPSLMASGTYRLIITFAEGTRENVVFVFSAKGVLSSELRE